ncbi:hypothetical protein HPB49_008822 [Dermacentor silvarum]|uniref:Uncharacterized protein n=1 Tax=Dermacentor silvarum TaxID=543639 RepID=A0ACB8CDZ0_DERSI|nr:hypothetical protein HPB49_008822 [Dermacentor silvarum]
MRMLLEFQGYLLVVLGTPAEEYACGKELLIRQGALDGIEVAIMSHPTPADVVAPLCSASQELVVRFKGKSAHAAAYPWEGVNALDAAIASFVNIGLLRQQCKPSSWIHGCEVSIRRAAAYMDVIQNAAIAASYRKHGHSLGLTFIDDYVKKLTVSGASTDCGNVSHRVPTLHAVYSVGSKEKVRGPANHTHQFATLAGSEEAQSPTLRTAKVLALTVLDLLTDAELMRKAQAEFAALQLQSDAELQAMTQ